MDTTRVHGSKVQRFTAGNPIETNRPSTAHRRQARTSDSPTEDGPRFRAEREKEGRSFDRINMIYRIPEMVRRFPNPESFRGPGKRLGFSTGSFLFNPGNPVNPVKNSLLSLMRHRASPYSAPLLGDRSASRRRQAEYGEHRLRSGRVFGLSIGLPFATSRLCVRVLPFSSSLLRDHRALHG